jgi:hypothetical protein
MHTGHHKHLTLAVVALSIHHQLPRPHLPLLPPSPQESLHQGPQPLQARLAGQVGRQAAGSSTQGRRYAVWWHHRRRRRHVPLEGAGVLLDVLVVGQ